MRSSLLIPVIIAAFFGSAVAASAQSQPAPGASSQGNVGPGASDMKSPKGMRSHSGKRKSAAKKSGSGMMQNDKATSANPSGQGNVGPGTNQAGSTSK